MRYILVIFMVLFVTSIAAQSKAVVSIAIVLGQQPILPEKKIAIPNTDDSLSVSVLKFYVSNFTSSLSSKNNALLDKRSMLFDFQSANGLNLHWLPSTYDMLSFVLGVDSIKNTSGALSGDLDPLNGMYWTWQSGYVNFKIEGTIYHKDSTKQEFTYHLGGYRSPNVAAQQVSLLSLTERSDYALDVDLTDFIKELMAKKMFHIMSPGKDAVELSALLAHSFKFKTP